jgi:hypothetical protein
LPFVLASAYSGGFFVGGDEEMRDAVRGLPLISVEGDIRNVGATYVADDPRA